MTISWVTRKDLGWPSMSKDTNTDQGMIAHYDGSRRLLSEWKRDGHVACIAYWRRVRVQHQGQGWRDVGYAYFVCPDRKVFEGRGVDRIQAAELPTAGKKSGGNTRYVAVTFGTGPGEMPTEGQLQAWHDLRDWLMDKHNVKPDVFGHRDFTSTDCPGDMIYPLRTTKLKNRPGGVTPPAPAPEGGEIELATLPTLSVGVEHNAVLTLRALLFERFLAERFDPTKTANDETNEDYVRFYGWLRNRKFDDDLRKDVVAYQKWRFPDAPEEHDGIVGPKTWGQLWQVGE